MSLAKTQGTTVLSYPYTPAMMEADNNNSNWGVSLDDAHMLEIFPLTDYAKNSGATLVHPVPTTPPAYNPLIQYAPIEQAPTFINGVLTQAWGAPVSFVPQTVSATQARMALNNAGLYAGVAAYMTLPTTNTNDVIAWNTATSFSRNSTLLVRLATALNLTSAQLDALFTAAAQIVF